MLCLAAVASVAVSFGELAVGHEDEVVEVELGGVKEPDLMKRELLESLRRRRNRRPCWTAELHP